MLTYNPSDVQSKRLLPLKGPLRVRETASPVSQAPTATRARLLSLERERDRLFALGDAMTAEFRDRFPNAPAYLTRYSDRTLTAYRWRRSSAAPWRGRRTPGANASLELTSEAGATLLAALDPAVRQAWLDYELRRVRLNHVLALTLYELQRLTRLREQMAAIRRLADPAEAIPSRALP